MKSVFVRTLEELEDKESVLRSAIQDPESALGRQRFEVDIVSFSAVPRSPFAYWVSDHLRRLFTEMPSFEADGRTAKQGLATADDFRFVRGWWEVPPIHLNERWFPFAKGGKFSPYYADVYLVVNWDRHGTALDSFSGSVIRNPSFFFRPGLTWPRRTKSGLSLRAMPAGCIFADKGPAVFDGTNDSGELLTMLSILNSQAFMSLVEFQLAAADARRGGAAHSYEVGVIQRTPMPYLGPDEVSTLARLAWRSWSLKRSLDTHSESSHAFILPALLQVAGNRVVERVAAWNKQIRSCEAELEALKAQTDERCFELYNIGDADRRAIIQGFRTGSSEPADIDTDSSSNEDDSDLDEEVDSSASTDTESLVAQLVSWACNAAFGRFDLRIAIGGRSQRREPDPFDPLPICAPGMLTGDNGLPLTHVPSEYPFAFPENGILVDDPGHARDLSAAVHAVFDQVFEPSADAWWSEAGTILDPKEHDLRTWLASSFFEYHLKRYSKSRRKAPIIWQLAVPSGRYSVWLNAHRLTRDSFFQIQNDVVIPKLAHEERQLANMAQNTGPNPSARDRKEITAQETFVEELRSFLNEIKRMAPLWNPTLDDGVALTMASLWRLVPQHKSWQKELRSKWTELTAGKYDWAHLAMHLWPERVVPKCTIDRSLAITHGLEDVFWIEGDDGKWQPRPIPTRPVEELVRERTSTAVKAALKSLLEAPASTMNRGRQRGLRAANAVADGGAN